MGELTSGVTRAFNLDAIKAGGIMVGGAILNSMVRDFIANQLKIDPKSPIRYVLGLSTAGLMGIGANRVMPGSGNQVFMGAMTFELARAYNQYLGAMFGAVRTDGMGRMRLGDFLQQPQVYNAVPSPMGDFLQQPQVAGAVPSPMGGFLDPYQRRLGGFLDPYARAGVSGFGDLAAIGDEMGGDLNEAV
ncbi:MAG: hypothetical protein ABII82_10905 [Verrucomicrobiota bacterium]